MDNKKEKELKSILSDEVMEAISGGGNLVRIDSPEEVRALRSLGYTVVKDMITGKYFVDK